MSLLTRLGGDVISSGIRTTVVLRAPICGTADFTERKLTAIVRKAEAYVSRLQELLLPDHSEEYAQLIRVTLPGRFQHVCRSVIPSRVLPAAKAFDDLQVDAYRAFCGSLSSDDLPAREVIFAQEGAGGRGFREMAVKVFELYDGAWAQSAHGISLRYPAGDPRASIHLPEGAAYGFHQRDEINALERFGLTHREELRRTHDLNEAVMHQSRLQSRHGVGSMLAQLRPTGLRIPTEPLPPLSSYSTTTRARLTSEMAPYSRRAAGLHPRGVD